MASRRVRHRCQRTMRVRADTRTKNGRYRKIIIAPEETSYEHCLSERYIGAKGWKTTVKQRCSFPICSTCCS